MIIVLFCSRLQTRCDLKHCFLLMAWVLSNSLLWLCILLSDRSCFSFCTAEFKWRSTFPKWELGVNIQERCCCFLLFPHFGLVPIHSKNILSTEFRHRLLSSKTRWEIIQNSISCIILYQGSQTEIPWIVNILSSLQISFSLSLVLDFCTVGTFIVIFFHRANKINISSFSLGNNNKTSLRVFFVTSNSSLKLQALSSWKKWWY